MLVTLPRALTFKATIDSTGAEPAIATPLAFVQVTTRPTAAHPQPVPVPLTYVKPVGSVSTSEMEGVAAYGPLLLTVSAYVAFVPIANVPLALIDSWRSATGGPAAKTLRRNH